MNKNKLVDIPLENLSKKQILEKIKKYIMMGREFIHIVSLNPENIVIANEDKQFFKAIRSAQIRIVDGSGIVMAAQMLHIPIGERVTGVGLTSDLMTIAKEMRLRVLLIGGMPNLAESIAKCQNELNSEAKFVGLEGIKDIKNPKIDEEARIFSIVTSLRPHLLFVSFGSPAQELWLYKNRLKLRGIVCMGVGGAFDFLSGTVVRAPTFLQAIGLEWLFRLIVGPWRWRRQLRLIKFIWLIILEKLNSWKSK